MGLGVFSPAGAQEPGQAALRRLDATVQKTCACAQAQHSGVNAALTCTADLKTFGRLKLEYAKKWTPPQQQLAGQIQRIVETCLGEARSYSQTLAKLGIEAPFAPPHQVPAPIVTPYYWKKIQLQALNQYSSRLVRIDTRAGESFKGLVERLDAGGLRLRRARSDGGGLLDFDHTAIEAAWVLLPAPGSAGAGS